MCVNDGFATIRALSNKFKALSKLPSHTLTETITNGCKVKFQSYYTGHDAVFYYFSYHVEIENITNDRSFQLLSRKWTIENAEGDVEVVEGPGVVGQTPNLPPQGVFSYNSGTHLITAVGGMSGSFEMVDDKGVKFQAIISPTLLEAAEPVLSNTSNDATMLSNAEGAAEA